MPITPSSRRVSANATTQRRPAPAPRPIAQQQLQPPICDCLHCRRKAKVRFHDHSLLK